MPAKTVAETLPPLPPTSVDFDALQKALRDGKTGKEAVAIATGSPEPSDPVVPAPAFEPDEITE